MNALITPKQQLKGRVAKEIEREYSRRYIEHQREISRDLAIQFTAAALYTLNVCEDFDCEHLRKFFNALNGTFEDMNGVGFAGEFDCDDLTELCKERFGIDLENEIKCVNCEWKRGGVK